MKNSILFDSKRIFIKLNYNFNIVICNLSLSLSLSLSLNMFSLLFYLQRKYACNLICKLLFEYGLENILVGAHFNTKIRWGVSNRKKPTRLKNKLEFKLVVHKILCFKTDTAFLRKYITRCRYMHLAKVITNYQ